MEKRKFLEKVKSWFSGLLVAAVLSGVMVLLFVPDKNFSQISKNLNFWSKSRDSEISQLKRKIDKISADLESLKSSTVGQSKFSEVENQIAAISEQITKPTINPVTASSKSNTNKSKNIESRPITNPSNLETRSLVSQPTSNSSISNNSVETKSSAAPAQTVSSKININTASALELDTLPGIGPTYAQRIIEYRESKGGFKSISEIQNVKGIGPKTFEKLKDMIEI